MTSVFFSYSHHDEADRDELEIHLKPLKREGVITVWHDRQIDAGDEIHGIISEHLESADIVLLLVSPHFLASDYCYDVELKRAMERHAAGTTRVIPVILDHCDWHSSPFGNLRAVPTDGKPIRKFPNQNEALLEVAKEIRKIAGRKPAADVIKEQEASAGPSRSQIRTDLRSSNLGIRKSFSDHERDVFLEQGFTYIANFFEGSLAELQRRNPEIQTRFRSIDSNRFAAYIYRDGKSVSQCGIRLANAMGKGIAYSSEPESTNSWNEHLSVCDNGTSLKLKSMGMASFGGQRDGELSLEGAAEELWAILVRPLQR